MSITLELDPATEAALKARANRAGVDMATFATNILRNTLSFREQLMEISGPLYQSFLESGMTDDEMSDFLEEVKHEMREEKRHQ